MPEQFLDCRLSLFALWLNRQPIWEVVIYEVQNHTLVFNFPNSNVRAIYFFNDLSPNLRNELFGKRRKTEICDCEWVLDRFAKS